MNPGPKRAVLERKVGFPFYLAALLWALASVGSLAQAVREYQVKAAFLYNFVQFVDWPASAFENTNAPIRIGILGSNPFGRALDDTVQNELVRNRKLVIQRARQADELKNCHLIFIARSEKNKIAEILSVVRLAPILTVSEVEGFVQSGGIVNFYLEGNKVRFELNPEAGQRQGLKISSELLALGKAPSSDVRKAVK